MKLELSCAGMFLVLVPLGVVACGSGNDGTIVSTNPVPTPTRPPSSGGSSSSSTSRPSDPDDDDVIEEYCPTDVPLTEADLDKEIGWKPGAPAQGSCTTADLQQLDANFADPNLKTYIDLGKGLSDACKACVVSKDTDATWGPVVATAENGGETGFLNYGACFGAIEGSPCGKAIQYESFCTTISCNQCATSSQTRAECVTIATGPKGMCEPFTNERTTSCPSWALNVKSCGEIKTAIATLCGTP